MSAIRRYKGYTLSEAQADLELWKNAKRAAATGKAYSIGTRNLTRYDLAEINRQIELFAGIVDALSAGHTGPVKLYARKSRW
jgi:hypothetical protein